MLELLSSRLAALIGVLLVQDALTLSTRAGANFGSIVNLGYGSFHGQNNPDGLNAFLGMPFAAPPTGDRRFGLPEPPIPFQGIRQANSYGAACPQQGSPSPPEVSFSSRATIPSNQSEDCLFINVIGPADVVTGKKLPILFYIYGGGFEIGDTSLRDGSVFVNRSIALDEPVIFVSANYRLSAFGFLGGKEVKAAGIGNAGLQDQIAALEWVQKHIAQFGGDPRRVTLMGESAGAISIGLQMVANDGNTNGLFTGAIMQSGSPIPLPEIQFKQNWFDFLAGATNCTDTSSDRLQCLRQVPYDKFLSAMNEIPNISSYQSVNLALMPMVDGRLIVRDPLVLLQQGKYAKIPFITGDAEDEGTVFSYSSLNVTTDEQFLDYVKYNFFPDINTDQLKAVAAAYPADPAQGSPFHTGTVDALTPEFKRIAAFQGDYIFQGPRRNFLTVASQSQPAYAFRYERGASTPGTGASHGSDLWEFLAQGNGTAFIGADAAIFFTNYGNPNAPKNSPSKLANVTWNKWASSSKNPPLLTFIDPAPSVNVTYDTYRQGPIALINKLLLTKVGRPF